MTNRYAVGIDYSMTSPSICIHAGDTWSILNCNFHYLCNKKKFEIKTANISGTLHLEYSSQEERFDNISNWAISVIPKNSSIALENYAFAATGTVFNIGECAGILKHKLWKIHGKFDLFSPSQIKKCATGKGNSNKIAMFHAFVQETTLDLSSTLLCKIGESPLSDIVDSYFIAKMLFLKHQKNL